ERNDIDVLAHPLWYHEDLSPHLSEEELENLLETAVENDTAIEFNGRYELPRNDTFLDLMEGTGVKVSIGVDAHSTAEVGRIDWMVETLEGNYDHPEKLILEDFL
ncbi:MAG: hypothetical protein ABEJ72_07090, partial [Candidatus Aenigmatarchaeota archaeon]